MVNYRQAKLICNILANAGINPIAVQDILSCFLQDQEMNLKIGLTHPAEAWPRAGCKETLQTAKNLLKAVKVYEQVKKDLYI
jgi:hypothetical protein